MARMPTIDNNITIRLNLGYKKAFALFLLSQVATTQLFAVQAIGGPAAYVVDNGTTNPNITDGSYFDQPSGTLNVGFENNAGTVNNTTALGSAAVASSDVDKSAIINVLAKSNIITIDASTVIAFDGNYGSVAPTANCTLSIQNTGTIANQNPINTNNPAGHAIMGDPTGYTSLNLNNNSDANIIGIIDMSQANNPNIITNSGTIRGNILAGLAGDNITNNASGSIIGNITAGNAANKITNSGTIGGNIIGGNGGDTITNNYNANMTGNIIGGNAANQITNSGTLNGDIVGGNGGDTITNNSGASLQGRISGGNTANIITNNGTIRDNILGGNGGDTIVNNGIVANIIGGSTTNTITNNGTLQNINAGIGGDNINNSGTLNSIIGGAGNDTITINGGTVLGIINGNGGSNVLHINGDFSTNAAIQSMATINVDAGTFIINNPITDVTTNFITSNGSNTIIKANLEGAGGSINNSGTLTLSSQATVGNAGAMGIVTNNGIINITSSVVNAWVTGAINNNGTINITNTTNNNFHSGIITNDGQLNINNYIANGIALTGLINNGTINVNNYTGVSANVNLGDFTANNGTLNINGSTMTTPAPFINNLNAVTNFLANFDIGAANTFNNDGKVNLLAPTTITGNYTNSGSHLTTINNGTVATLTAGIIDFATNPNILEIKTTGDTILANGYNVTIATANNNVAIPLNITVANNLSTTLDYSAAFVNANNVQVTVNRTPIANIVLGDNQITVANIIDNLINDSSNIHGDLRFTLAAFDQLTTPESINQAVQKLMPSLEAGKSILSGFNATNLAIGAIEGRINNAIRQDINYASNPESSSSGYSSGDTRSDRNFWVKGFNANNNQKSFNDSSGYKADTVGVIFGIDNQVTDNFWLGTGISYAYSYIKTKSYLKNLTAISNYQATLYSSYSKEKYYIDSFAAFAYNDYRTKREVQFADVNKTAIGKFYGLQPSAKIGTGYINQYNDFLQIIPNISLQYTRLRQSQYNEEGAGSVSLNNINSKNLQQLEGGLGVKFAMLYKDSGHGTATSHDIHLMALYNIINSKQEATASLSGGGGTFAINGSKTPRTTFNLGIGLTYMLKDSLYCSLNYDLRIKKQFVGHLGSLTAKYFI